MIMELNTTNNINSLLEPDDDDEEEYFDCEDNEEYFNHENDEDIIFPLFDQNLLYIPMIMGLNTTDNINSLLEPDDEDDEEEYLDCEDNEEYFNHENDEEFTFMYLDENNTPIPADKALKNKDIHPIFLHLFEMVSKEEFNTCAFFNPTIIQGRVCDQESNFAIKHILATVEAHKEKEIFLAPYLQDSHWVLFLICPKTRTGYIFDSYKRDKKKTSNSFYLSNIVERSFDNSFKWTMLEIKYSGVGSAIEYAVLHLKSKEFFHLYLPLKPPGQPLKPPVAAVLLLHLPSRVTESSTILYMTSDFIEDLNFAEQCTKCEMES
ncbi:ulp1 protease family, C-terminal catalytic domain-containing protein [Tanacetum coccineum]